MKNLRKIAGISILLILFFMVLALFRFQSDGESSALPYQFKYNFDEDWEAAVLNSQAAAGEDRLEMLRKDLAEKKWQKVTLPFTGNSRDGNTVVLKNTLPEDYAGMTVNFSTAGAAVEVFLDDELIYQYGGEKEDDVSGTMEHYADVPNAFHAGELWVVLTSPDPDTAAELRSMKVETRSTVVIGLVGNNIADIGCCLLIILMSIIMFVLAMIRLYTRQPARGELFLGLTGLAAGIYCFIRTDTLSIFYNVQEAYEMQEYLVLLMPLFLAMYFEWNLHSIYPYRFSILILFTVINAVIQISLELLGIQNLAEMVNITAAIIGAVCIIAIVSLIQFDFRNRHYQALLSVLSMLVLLSGGIANVMINTFFQELYGNTAGQYSMVLFSIMMAAMHTLQISREYRANAEESARLLSEEVKAAEQQNIQLAQAKQDAEAARQEALAANEAKGKFLAHMSHEIRTPINAVLGMDEMILRESAEPQIRDYAMDIYMAGQTLLSLINDILDFSKIDSGKMEIVPVEYDVSSLIHDLTNMASQRAREKGIRFEVEVDQGIPSRLWGDDVRIRQVITNILTNAVKYTPEGTVWLRMRSLESEGPAVLWVEVEDTGIGIKEEDLPKLSAEFERIEEDRNRNIEGTGLGMSITIQLLNLMGSKLQMKSDYGKGSKFYFQLEQEIVDATPIGDFESRVRQISENYSHGTGFLAPEAKVLVVDDNAVNRKVFRNLLKETQILVTDAGGGAECLELVQKEHYDLIFLDHMMPEMDGMETFRRMKGLSDYPCQDTPIIVLTANAVSGAKEKYLAEGFDDFLSKPIVPEKLEDMIRRMLPEELVREAADHAGDSSPRQTEYSLEELPQVDGLDWNYAWLHLPDEELLEYTVKEFYSQIDTAADTLEASYSQIDSPGQSDAYRIQVHAMKSLAATIGIVPLAGLAKLLEYAARDGRTDLIKNMTEPFLEEWRSYRQKLQGVFGLEDGPGMEVTDYSVLQALVEMVRVSMQEMDIDQADQFMGQLQSYDYPEELNRNIRKLAEAVTNLDGEEADRFGALLIEQMGRQIGGETEK